MCSDKLMFGQRKRQQTTNNKQQQSTTIDTNKTNNTNMPKAHKKNKKHKRKEKLASVSQAPSTESEPTQEEVCYHVISILVNACLHIHTQRENKQTNIHAYKHVSPHSSGNEVITNCWWILSRVTHSQSQ